MFKKVIGRRSIAEKRKPLDSLKMKFNKTDRSQEHIVMHILQRDKALLLDHSISIEASLSLVVRRWVI